MTLRLFFRVFRRSAEWGYDQAFSEVYPLLGGFDIESPSVLYLPIVLDGVDPVYRDGKKGSAVFELVASRKVASVEEADELVQLFSEKAVSAELTSTVKTYFLDKEPS